MSIKSIEVLQRVLAFAATHDFEELPAARLREHVRTVAEVASQAGYHDRHRRFITTDVRQWLPRISEALPWGTARARAATAATLAELRRRFDNDILRRLFPEEGFGDLPGASATLRAHVSGVRLQRLNTGSAAGVELLFAVDDWETSFWLSIAALLEEHGSRIRRCSKCHALFMKLRKEVYCSRKCGNAARANKWYHKHGKRRLSRNGK